MTNKVKFLSISAVGKQGLGNFRLKAINFWQRRYQKIAIAGETGSGKSTLLKIIAGLEQTDEGEVLFQNEKVKGPADQLVPGHAGIAYLPQDFNLPKFLNVELVLTYANSLTPREAEAIFKVCQISHLMQRKSNELSGGERQRIALAKLLITSPQLLLLDEPFSNLDMVHKNTLKSVLQNIGEKLKITCILVSHDPLDVLSWADKIVVMKDGKIVQKGSPQKIYNNPTTEYVAGLFGKYNRISSANAALWGLHSKGKYLLTRPETFKLTNKKDKLPQGTVTQITFFGSFYEVVVLINGYHIKVNSKQLKVDVGDTVNVKCLQREVGIQKK